MHACSAREDASLSCKHRHAKHVTIDMAGNVNCLRTQGSVIKRPVQVNSTLWPLCESLLHIHESYQWQSHRENCAVLMQRLGPGSRDLLMQTRARRQGVILQPSQVATSMVTGQAQD